MVSDPLNHRTPFFLLSPAAVKLPAVEVSDSSQTPEVDPSQSTPLSMGPVPTVTSFGLHHKLAPMSTPVWILLLFSLLLAGQHCWIPRHQSRTFAQESLQ